MEKNAFTSYFKKLFPIMKDCTTSVENAKKNPERYKIYKMRQKTISEFGLGIDEEKTKEYESEIRELLTMIPHRKTVFVSNACDLSSGLNK